MGRHQPVAAGALDARIAPLEHFGSNSRLAPLLRILRCPKCGLEPHIEECQLTCARCREIFPVIGGIPRVFVPKPATASDVTGRIQDFYEAHPFPDYEGFEDVASLIERAREGVFARLLDEQIPFGVRILDCGCGTGQLTNFLGIAHRTVIGTDLSTASLELAERFRSQHQLKRVFFLQMSLFEPCFEDGSFDYVICNGVLHHTSDPRGGLGRLSRLVKPGGHLIVGLYHRYGRLATDFRRTLFRLLGQRVAFLDPRFRRRLVGEGRWSAWFADQYQNPHESKHTIRAVRRWLPEVELEFVKSIPKTRFFSPFSSQERLFEAEDPGGSWEAALKECSMALHPDSEGGFFTIVARKPA
jgi:SAM-dependent methyltransferase